MSGQRPRSPGFRRFPWEEPDFDPYKVLEELDEDQMDSRSNWSREGSGDHLGHFRVDIYAEGQRKSSSFSGNRPFGHQHHSNQDEFYHRRPLPHHDEMLCGDRRTSSPRDGRVDGDRHRGGFESYSFGNRGRSPHSPPRFMRERLSSMPRSRSEHRQREPERGLGWRKEEQGTAHPGNLSLSRRSEDQRRRNPQCPSRDGQRHGSHLERNPSFKKQRRETDDGFRTEEEFLDQHHPVDLPRYRFGGVAQETHVQRDVDHSGPLVVEHDHGMAHGRGASQWSRFNDGRDPHRQRSPRHMSSSQPRFRLSDRRLDGPRGRQDNWNETKYHESRSGSTSQNGTHDTRYSSQDGPMNYRGRGGPLSARGHDRHSEGGRTGPHRNQTQMQQSSRGNEDRPPAEPRLGYRPFKDKNPVEGDAGWSQETRPQWKLDKHGSVDRHLKTERIQGWNSQKDMTVETEETLTIKVDMSRPVHQNSLLCYSSDRQLSLDLVNVGRQRLDFLPMLEHSGTYRETAIHTGTFAQEIITLVHHVKEQYFRDAGITMNQRFSALPTGSQSEAEIAELTLDQRFSSKRGFSLKMSSLLDDDEPLFSRLEPLPPVRGPGDLRHDLDRKRQERLEGVKVTISGNILSQHPLAPFSALDPEFTHKDKLGLMEDEGPCNWRQDNNMGSRGGVASYRPTSGFQRKNTRFSNRLGPMSQQNNTKGPHW